MKKISSKNIEMVLCIYIGISVVLHILFNTYLIEGEFVFIDYYVDSPFYTISNIIVLIFEAIQKFIIEVDFFTSILGFVTDFNHLFFNGLLSIPYLSILFESLNWTIMYVLFVVLVIIIIIKKFISVSIKLAVVVSIIYAIYSIYYQYALSKQYQELEYISTSSYDDCECVEVSVYDVVDGDTIKVNYNGVEETIRLLYIDTPEATTEIEEYGLEATNMLKGIINTSDAIYLEFDGSERDKYGRVLAWVWADDVLVQEILTKNGLVEDFYDYGNYKYEDIINAAMKYAEDNELKIHSK